MEIFILIVLILVAFFVAGWMIAVIGGLGSLDDKIALSNKNLELIYDLLDDNLSAICERLAKLDCTTSNSLSDIKETIRDLGE